MDWTGLACPAAGGCRGAASVQHRATWNGTMGHAGADTSDADAIYVSGVRGFWLAFYLLFSFTSVLCRAVLVLSLKAVYSD